MRKVKLPKPNTIKNLLFLVCARGAVVLFLPSCQQFYDLINGGGGSPAPKSIFTIMTNGFDPLLVKAKPASGETIDFFGTRDDKGVPLKVNRVVINNSQGESTYSLDEIGRPTSMFAPNGVQFKLTWTGPQKAIVTAISPQGGVQLNTEIDFTKSSSLSAPSSEKEKRSTEPLQILFTPLPTKALTPASTNIAYSTTVNVTQCGSAADAEVGVVARTTSGEVLGNFPSTQIQKGTYGVMLPTSIAPKINPKDVCTNLAGIIGDVCITDDLPTFIQAFCVQLSVRLAATGIGVEAAAVILGGCEVLTSGLSLLCSTVGGSPAPGAPSVADQLCAASFLDRTFISDIVLVPYAVALPSNVYGSPVQVPGAGPYPALSVDLGSKTYIRSLTLNPPSPVAKQGYQAVADVSCILVGSLVTMSIVGTDGYSNSVLYSVTSTQSNGRFTLNVPGAATAGIVDKVTIQIKLPSGEIITTVASLVFS